MAVRTTLIIMEEFKKIEDYPIVGEISQEELSKYDDYVEKAVKESEKARIEDWKNSKDEVV